MNIWESKESVEQIKKTCPSLSDIEFETYVALGRATGLNPFKKEVWCVKYGSSPAQIFIGRDGYRTVALNHKDYDYHQSDSVYENDDFKVINGEIQHTYCLKDRGKLIGAYCITKRKSSSKAVYHFVKLSEYNTGKSLWQTKPDTMLKKVSEAHALRASFQDVLGGTYIPEEMPEHLSENRTSQAIEISKDIDYELPDKIRKIYDLVSEKGITKDRLVKMFYHYKVDSFMSLNSEQANDLLDKLIKMPPADRE